MFVTVVRVFFDRCEIAFVGGAARITHLLEARELTERPVTKSCSKSTK